MARALQAAIFDLDGVITRTARVHFASWKKVFDEVLGRHAKPSEARPFDEADYQAYVDGKPRLEGIRAFLASRGIALPLGEPTDPPTADTVHGLGQRKNASFLDLLDQRGIDVDPATVGLIRALRASGVRVGVASSSRNASDLLDRAELNALFDAQVDGIVSASLGLRGKPHPDIFLECLRRLGGFAPQQALVVEDAASGVAAGKAGGFGLVLAIDRGGNHERLQQAGADWVVSDLSAVSADDLARYFRRAQATGTTRRRELAGWVLAYDQLEPAKEGLREALCTLGNGFFATRGAAEEQHANATSYPGTYIIGGYNQLASEVAGHQVINEDLVNFPNWLWLTFRPTDGEWLDLWRTAPLSYRQELRLREGLLCRRFRVVDSRGRITSIQSRRLVHMDKPHLAAIEWQLVPENWSGAIVLHAGLDGAVTNDGVARYRQLARKHLEICQRAPVAPEGIYLTARTSQSHLEVALAARTRVFTDEQEALAERRLLLDDPERIAEELCLEVRQGETLRVEKVVALFSSRDRGISEAGIAARLAMAAAPSFEALLRTHRAAWARLWRRCDVEVNAEPRAEAAIHDELVLRLHIFHLLQTASPHTAGLDVGIPARGLHGEAYRGHVFWDELFILPFYVQRMPALVRSIIRYRYHRLDAARELAREAGCAGAAFPWQSASDGREVTQRFHLNPLSGRWSPDYSHLQRHVNSAIVYNIWRYYQATGDRAFVEAYGAEIILEIARFWSSLATWNPATERYDITGVMGPDEYHEKYPDAEVGGLKNNAYTNITAVWCLLRARDTLAAISRQRRAEICQMLALDEAELARWDDISRRITIAFHDGVISQFEGYGDLEELDWHAYAQRYGRIERLDRILRAEGTSTDRFKVSKQADVVMLLYLFSVEELESLFARLGYPCDEEAIYRSVQYYLKRTSHGSTLSKVVFTSAVHREDSEAGCQLFVAALQSDLYDVQGGTTPEGVHLGAMAGTVDIVMRHYAGVALVSDGVHLVPDMPRRVRWLRFRIQYRGRWLDIELSQRRLRASVDDADPGPVWVHIQDRQIALAPGETIEVSIEPRWKKPRHPVTLESLPAEMTRSAG